MLPHKPKICSFSSVRWTHSVIMRGPDPSGGLGCCKWSAWSLITSLSKLSPPKKFRDQVGHKLSRHPFLLTFHYANNSYIVLSYIIVYISLDCPSSSESLARSLLFSCSATAVFMACIALLTLWSLVLSIRQPLCDLLLSGLNVLESLIKFVEPLVEGLQKLIWQFMPHEWKLVFLLNRWSDPWFLTSLILVSICRSCR